MGIEINEAYCEQANRRVNEFLLKAPLELFDEREN